MTGPAPPQGLGTGTSDLVWSLDASFSDTTNFTYLMGDNYDLIYVIYEITDTSGLSINTLDMRFDGVSTTTYDYMDFDATETTGDTEFFQTAIVNGNATAHGAFLAGGRGDLFTFKNLLVPAWGGNVSGVVNHGTNDSVSSPIDQFTFIHSDASFNIAGEVYGVNV